MKAARRIFARDGFEASRIDDIARGAGYTRGAFYAHFESKEELFLALVEEQGKRGIRELRALLEKEHDDRARLKVIRDYYASKVADEDWCILALEFKLYAVRHPKERKRLAEAHRRVRSGMKLEALAECMPASLRVDSKNREQVRSALEALLCGLVLQASYDPDGLSRSQAKSVLKTCFETLTAGA